MECDDMKFDRRFQHVRRTYYLHLKGLIHRYWQEYGVYLIISLDVLSDGLSMIEKREARHREAMLNYECY
jgi:hypothetical protein